MVHFYCQCMLRHTAEFYVVGVVIWGRVLTNGFDASALSFYEGTMHVVGKIVLDRRGQGDGTGGGEGTGLDRGRGQDWRGQSGKGQGGDDKGTGLEWERGRD